MAYGILKCDTVTFTDAGVDKSVTLSGLVQNPTFSGNVTVTGTLSGVTVTGTTANFTSGNFTNISGGTHTITSGVFAAGSAASPSITFTGDLNTGIYSPGADQFAFAINGTERARIDSSGRLLVGTASDLSGGVANTSFQLAASSGSGVSTIAQIYSFNSGGGVAALDLCRSKSTTLGTNTTVAKDDYIGSLNFKGANGSSYLAAASVSCEIDGTVSGGGAADMPGRLVFSTTADGASFPTERMKIAANGQMTHSLNGTTNAANLTLNVGGVGDPGNSGWITPRIDFVGSALASSGTTFIGATGALGGRSLVFATGSDAAGTERARIDSSGRLLVGTSTSPSNAQGSLSKLIVQGYVGADTEVGILSIQRGEAATSITVDEAIGQLAFNSSDGGTFAHIQASADATAGNNDYPGRLVFSTTADGASSPTERMRITSGGELLVGGTNDNGAYNIQCNGTGVWGFGAYVNGSDECLKENINPLPASLDVVKALNPVVFQYKPEFTADTSVQPGFIAQELQTALAGQVYVDGVVRAGGQYLNVAYQALIPVLTKALQEAIGEIELLKTRIADLERA